jgi:hypothetical protein
MDTAILSQAFIYIMYPSNYDPNDINTRQFYIGSTFNNCNDIKKKFYDDLYKGTTEKKITIMRKYMKSNNFNIIEDKEKPEDKKLWQFRILFAGLNCCSKSLLKSLEGLYIYYYYSILNDEDITFKPANITDNEIEFFNEIGILEHLYKCYNPFTIEDLIYDVNPYTLIKKDETLKQFLHIYKEICERPSIPKFEDTEHLTFQYWPQNDDFEYRHEYPCYEPGPINRPYKCKWCVKSYKFYNCHLYYHLIDKHRDEYNDTIDNFMTHRPQNRR